MFSARMVIFFDVDATLITTSRTGVAAMGLAGRELLGHPFDEEKVEYAGRLDPLIIADLLVAHGQDPSPARVERFRAAYREHLAVLLVSPGLARPCPGVPELLDELEAMARDTGDPVLGLLTGNYPETGSIKLRACGIEPSRFAVRVWGNDSPHDPPAREHLPSVGMERFRARYQREVEPSEVVIVGDTPHDVSSAKANGCRSLGVATGRFDVAELERAGADLALADLRETKAVVRWMIGAA